MITAADLGMRGPRSLRVGLLHLAPVLGAVEVNRSLVQHGTIRGAELGADWVISGELVVCGDGFEALIGTDWILPQPDAWMSRLAELTASLRVVSFLSHPERDASTGRLFDSMFVLGRDGRLLGRQRKLNPIPISEDWSSPGRLGSPIVVDDIRVGLLICADVYRPGPAKRLGELGAELLVSSAAWWPGEWGPCGEWEARTVETRLPMIVCNRTGADGERRLVDSESVVVDRGERLLTLRSPVSTVFIVDCELRAGRIVGCEVAVSCPLEVDSAPPGFRESGQKPELTRGGRDGGTTITPLDRESGKAVEPSAPAGWLKADGSCARLFRLRSAR